MEQGKVTLRGYQNECIEGTRNAFRMGRKKVACVLPTGSGKTTIFGSICKRFSEKGGGRKSVIISHLGLLTSQTGDRFREEWGLASEVLQADRLPSIKAQTIITTMQSFRSEDKLLGWSRKLSFGAGSLERLNIGLIIIDECHLMGNDSYQNILEMFPNAYIIGFTATPFRQNKLMTNLFDSVAYTVSTQELIDQGYLVPPVLNQIDYDTTDQADMFAKIINAYKAKHQGHKAVVYLKTIEEANLCRNILEDAGITSRAVTSKLTGDSRDELLKTFRSGGGPDILTTVDVLTAGFDSPNLRAIFMPYKVGSVTTYLQRVGRGLRPDAGKSQCDVYVNSNAPKIEAGFWEKVNKQMLNVGRNTEEFDLSELLEMKDIISKEEYVWTKEVVDMAKQARLKGMESIYNMIVKREFPKEMLDCFVESPPVFRKSKVKATEKQKKYVESIGYNASTLTKVEASAIIDMHRRSKGWKPSQEEIVPHGKHKGKHFSQVPPAYWRFVPNHSPLMKAYRTYKEGR